MEIYCVKCRSQQSVLAPSNFVTKNNRTAIRGECATCHGKVVKIIGKIATPA